MAQLGPGRLVPGLFVVSAALFLAEAVTTTVSEPAGALALYAHTALFGSALGSAFWSLVSEQFDPREAKRQVGRIASGGTVGGVLAGVAVWRASAYLPAPRMLALLSMTNLVAWWGTRARGGGRSAAAPVPAARTRSVLTETPYLRDLGALVVSAAALQALLDWLLSAHARQTYDHAPDLLGFFALYNVMVGILTFAVQRLVTARALERRGLAGTLRLSPLAVAGAVAGAMVWPTFAGAAVVRVVEAVSRGSLFRSTYELFYTPLPASKKRAAKTLIDVGLDRLGTAVGGVALFVLARAVPHNLTRATYVVLCGVLMMAGVAWLLAGRLQRGYVSALADNLRSGAITLEHADDLTTRTTLAETTAMLDRDKLLSRIEALRKADAGTSLAAPNPLSPAGGREDTRAPEQAAATEDPLVIRAAILRGGSASEVKRALAAPLERELAALAVAHLADPAVARDAMRALRRAGARATGALVDALLDATVAVEVRRRIPRALSRSSGPVAQAGLLAALGDSELEVRRQSAIAMARLGARPDPALTWSLVRAEVARASQPGGAREGEIALVFLLAGLALDPEPLQVAARALTHGTGGLRGTALEYLEAVLPADVRETLLPLLEQAPSSTPSPNARRPVSELAEDLLRSRG